MTATMDREALDANVGGLLEFYQRFQQLQLQRDTSDALTKVPTQLNPRPFLPFSSPFDDFCWLTFPDTSPPENTTGPNDIHRTNRDGPATRKRHPTRPTCRCQPRHCGRGKITKRPAAARRRAGAPSGRRVLGKRAFEGTLSCRHGELMLSATRRIGTRTLPS